MSWAVIAGAVVFALTLLAWIASGFDGQVLNEFGSGPGGQFVWLGVISVVYFAYRTRPGRR